MKLLSGFIFSLLYSSAAGAASLGHVYISDPARSSKTHGGSVDPETARLILAQRLGVSKFHALPSLNSKQLQTLNEFGGRPQALFGGDRDRNDAHVLVWVDNVEKTSEFVSDASRFSQFTITRPPPTTANKQLVDDFLKQAESLPSKVDPKQKLYNSQIRNWELLNEVQEATTSGDYLSVLHLNGAGDAQVAPKLASALKQLSQLSDDEGFSLTVVLMPPVTANSKRSAKPYGIYDLPSVEARRERAEAILSASSPASSVNIPNVSIKDDDSPQVLESKPVAGILPPCFQSQRDCERRTGNCTGHGSCGLVRKGVQGQGKCYSCQCQATVVDVKGGGKRTTHWGGPACQKKDVTVPFWLIAGSSIILALLVAGGVGLLYSMGDEELPSVIGAGVSGPVRK